MKSFEEQYPGYAIIPEKRSKGTNLLILLATIAALIAVPGYVIFKLSQLQVPTPSMSGFNAQSLTTLAGLAATQVQSGDFTAAAINYQKYFALGGRDIEAMVLYASSLSALGDSDLALRWTNKALLGNPQSQAALFLKNSLENKK